MLGAAAAPLHARIVTPGGARDKQYGSPGFRSLAREAGSYAVAVRDVTQHVPFLDLAPLSSAVEDDLLTEFADLVGSGQFVNGPQVASFEEAFAEWCGVPHCVGTASGLDALRLGLVAVGLDPGDEVVLPAMTFVATAEAVAQAGGQPVLADISEHDWNLDPAAAADAATTRTRFLVPVHLYGQMADVRTLADWGNRRGLAIIEDACQAH